MSPPSQHTHRKIVVIGGTGKQGSAAINALQKLSSSTSPIDIVTLTRDPQSKKAQELKEHGVELVQTNLDEVTVDKLAEIFSGVNGLFCAQSISDREVEQGKKIIDAAEKADIQLFVYSSVRQADNAPTVSHFHSKFLIEEYLKKSSIKHYTILRPVSFMENLIFRCEHDKVYFWTDEQAVVQHIACEDIGIFAAQAFINPKDFDHQTIELAGDTMNGFQLAETFSKVLARPMKYEKMIAKDETHRSMANWIENNKFIVDVQNLKKKYNIKMKTIEDFITENKNMFN